MSPHKPHIVFNGRWKVVNKCTLGNWGRWFSAARWCDRMNMKGTK